MNIALIIAGGNGKRMRQDIPKQFIHVNNKPIILYTLEVFQNHPEIDFIEVVCLDGWHEALKAYACQFNITKLKQIVSGGETRFDSIYKGMLALGKLNNDDVIIIHDAVRPIVPAETISGVISICKKYGASISVLPCTDTMYITEGAVFTHQNISRDTLVRGQTPEAVTYKRALWMYNEAEKMKIKNDSITALQVALGEKVYFTQGSEKNIKITTVDDIEIFKALLKSRRDDWIK